MFSADTPLSPWLTVSSPAVEAGTNAFQMVMTLCSRGPYALPVMGVIGLVISVEQVVDYGKPWIRDVD